MQRIVFDLHRQDTGHWREMKTGLAGSGDDPRRVPYMILWSLGD